MLKYAPLFLLGATTVLIVAASCLNEGITKNTTCIENCSGAFMQRKFDVKARFAGQECDYGVMTSLGLYNKNLDYMIVGVAPDKKCIFAPRLFLLLCAIGFFIVTILFAKDATAQYETLPMHAN